MRELPATREASLATNKRNPQNGRVAFWKDRARLLRVISHPVRLLILEALVQGSSCVKDLNSIVGINQPNLSQHMAVLRKANLVGCHKSGPLRCYYIQYPTLVNRLIGLLSKEHEERPRSRESVLRQAR